MGVVDPLKGPSYTSMTCSDNFIFNPNYVNRFRTKIMSYLPLEESSTWKFQVTIFIALILFKVENILTFILVVILTPVYAFLSQHIFLGLIFSIRILVTIVELHPLSNNIRKLLNFALPFCVFVHPCTIGE